MNSLSTAVTEGMEVTSPPSAPQAQVQTANPFLLPDLDTIVSELLSRSTSSSSSSSSSSCSQTSNYADTNGN